MTTKSIERICEECQAKFTVKLGDFGRKYCSKVCYRKKLGRLIDRQAKLDRLQANL